ncbi:hypothetical protein ACRAWD_16945 [Caulobacter segnis]
MLREISNCAPGAGFGGPCWASSKARDDAVSGVLNRSKGPAVRGPARPDRPQALYRPEKRCRTLFLVLCVLSVKPSATSSRLPFLSAAPTSPRNSWWSRVTAPEWRAMIGGAGRSVQRRRQGVAVLSSSATGTFLKGVIHRGEACSGRKSRVGDARLPIDRALGDRLRISARLPDGGGSPETVSPRRRCLDPGGRPSPGTAWIARGRRR